MLLNPPSIHPLPVPYDLLVAAPAPSVGAGSVEPEAVLVQRLQRGDEDSFELLVRRYGGAMLAVARRMLRNEEAAKDVVQDAFLQAFRSITRFREDARLSTWLHRIVVNAALMRMRTASRRPEQSIEDLLPHFDEQGAHSGSLTTLPVAADQALESAETRALVRSCIAQLPEPYRAVILLRDFEELSTAEVATLLGITENAAKIRLHRARQALRTLLCRVLGDQ